jgi:hypothetical protein
MPTTPVPVSAENDCTQGSTHHSLLLLAGFPDIWDCAAPMNYLPGSWASRHCLTTNVKFNEQRIVLDGHDQGPLLFHLPIADSYRSLKSNRKNIYSASQVKANGTPLACVNDEKFRMMACGDPVCSPFAFNCNNSAYNLLIGLSSDDEFRGDVAKFAAIIVDTVSFVITCATGNVAPEAASDVLGDFFGADPVKLVVGAKVGLAASIITSAASGWKEPIVYKMETGNGFRAISHELSYNPSSGEWAHKGTQNTVGLGKNEYGGSIYKPAKATTSSADAPPWGDKL